MKVILADDHQLFLEGLSSLLKLISNYEIVDKVANTNDLINSVMKHQPDLVIQDYRMPETNAITIINKIKSIFPKTKVILLTGVQSNEIYKQILNSKADGILLKEISGDDLLSGIHGVIAGQRILSPAVQNCLKSYDHGLSRKEFEVLELIFEGMNSLEIAERLMRSPKTIENHRYNLMKKLNVRNVAELMRYVHNSGVLDG